MPPIERCDQQDYAVLWRSDGVDNYGEPTVGSAEEIRVRWEDRQEETKDAIGNAVMLDAIVKTAEHIPIGSRMWLGRLEDIPGTSFSEEDEELMEVVWRNRVPDIKSRVSLRVYGLKKFREVP